MPNYCCCEVEIIGNVEFLENLAEKSNYNEETDSGFLKAIIEPSKEEDSKDWRMQFWGTKWEVEPYHIDLCGNILRLSFDSAWTPPTEALSHLLENDLIDNVKCVYYEGNLNFGGIWEDGEDFYEDNVTRSFLLNCEIGRELDETYAIIEGRTEILSEGDDVVVLKEHNGYEFKGTYIKEYDQEIPYGSLVESSVDLDGIVNRVTMITVKDLLGNSHEVKCDHVEADF